MDVRPFLQVFGTVCKAKEMSLIISSGSIMFNSADLHDSNSVLRKNTNEHGPFRPCP